MNPLELAGLTALMAQTSGNREVVIGLLDGPIIADHPQLATENIRHVSRMVQRKQIGADGAVNVHGTFVAGILAARRDSAAPAICPDCTLLVRPIFHTSGLGHEELPSATAEEVAVALVECIEAGARVINLSATFAQPSSSRHPELEDALSYALQRGVLVVVAAGNQGTLGSSTLTRHPWVIPVVAYDSVGRPVGSSNLGHSIATFGLGAPGNNVISLGPDTKPLTMSGTSAAAPFVTGSIALLWSAFSKATAAEVKYAVTQANYTRRKSVVPPLLNAWTAYEFLRKSH